jgi:hypothetical protein
VLLIKQQADTLAPAQASPEVSHKQQHAITTTAWARHPIMLALMNMTQYVEPASIGQAQQLQVGTTMQTCSPVLFHCPANTTLHVQEHAKVLWWTASGALEFSWKSHKKLP